MGFKKVFVLTVTLLVVQGLGAQTNGKFSSLLHQSALQQLMAPQMASDSRVLSERVIAQSTYDNFFGSKSDSVDLNYSTNGASVYDFSMMLYPYNYPYSKSPLFNNYLGSFVRPQVEYSEYSHWTINPNTLVYGFYQQDKVAYDAALNLVADTALYADSTIIPNMVYSNKFNAANKIDTAYSFLYSAGSSAPAFRQFFTYNASNKITKDSTYEYVSGTWKLVSKTFYSYDGSGNLIQINNFSNNDDTTFTLPLVEQLRYVNTFDASGRLKTVNTSYYDGTALNPYVIDSFAYTATSTFHLSWKQYQYDAINMYWAPMTYMTKTLNGAGFPDVININTFDSLANMWVPSVKQMAYYNASNNPVKLDEYIYNFSSFPSTPDFTTHYYYESFNDTTAGIYSSALENNLIVFPNPATDKISIKGFDKHVSGLNIEIFDVCGKLQFAQTTFISDASAEIPVGSLTPGMYFVRIFDQNKNIISQKPFVKTP